MAPTSPGRLRVLIPLPPAQFTDAGPYDVVVTNTYGRATSEVATLTVRTPLNLTWLGLAVLTGIPAIVNWVTDTSANVAYTPGDNVTFDVNGSGSASVNLTGPLSPSAVVVNAANDYTLSTSVGGGIVGISRLTKSGAGTLVLDTDNSYTGPTADPGRHRAAWRRRQPRFAGHRPGYEQRRDRGKPHGHRQLQQYAGRDRQPDQPACGHHFHIRHEHSERADRAQCRHA